MKSFFRFFLKKIVGSRHAGVLQGTRPLPSLFVSDQTRCEMKFAQFPHSEVAASQGGDMESEGSDLDE